MPSSITAKSSTPSRFPFPCHLLVPGIPENGAPPLTDREALYKMWFISIESRRQIARKLVQIYRGGCGVVSPTLQRLFAVVEPSGAVRDLAPPHHLVEMWELANAPKADGECACANFVDPEIGGPWRLRQTEEHHPMCQFDRHAMRTFKEAQKRSISRIREGRRSIERPDEWTRIRKEISQT